MSGGRMSATGVEAGVSTATRRGVVHLGKFIPPPYAGIEKHIDTLLRALQGIVPCALVAADSPCQPVTDGSLPYPVVPVANFGKLMSATISPGVLIKAQRMLSVGGFSILHTHVPNPWADVMAFVMPNDCALVTSWHSDIVRQKWLMPVYGRLQAAALRRAEKIVVPTQWHYDSSEQLRGLNVEGKIEIVPYGIDVADLAAPCRDDQMTEEILRFAAGRRIVLTVGRHVYYKGYDYLLRAFAKVRSPSVLIMVGSGVLTNRLKALAVELGIERRVCFTGEISRSALASAIHACDFFTLPSIERAEAFGIASAEAMAFGKPTVVCRLGTGVDDLNRDGVTSLLVPPKDIDALADALEMLLKDDALRASMGRNAQAWIRENFSVERMRDKMLAVYAKLS